MIPIVTNALVLHVQGNLVLGVARRGTHAEWGIPGGRIEHNETPAQAAAREMFEETRLSPVTLEPVFVGRTSQSHTITFVARAVVGVMAQGDAGPVSFVTWETLFMGPFSRYMLELHRAWEAWRK